MSNQINLSIEEGLSYAEFQARLRGFAEGVNAAVNEALLIRQQSITSTVPKLSENRAPDDLAGVNGKAHSSNSSDEASS